MTLFRVLLVEDHEMVAGAFRAAIDAEDDLAVVGTASTAGQAVERARALQPDVAVVDYRLPDGEAADLVTALLEAHEPLRILVVTGWPNERALVRSVEAGAHGFLSKTQRVEELVDAVRRVAGGEAVFAPDVLGRVLGLFQRQGSQPRNALSSRELDVLHLLGEGRTTAEIAAQLFLSVNTVRNHIASVLTKLHARSRLEAVTEAMRLGLITAPDQSG